MDSIYLISILCSVLAFIPAIVFHEFMHGWAAWRLGDDTAKQQGRLSFNPIKHIDPFGTVILPALLILIGGPVFGYAKPVPYNPHNFKNPRRDDLLVGLAGPAGNLVLALAGAALMFGLQGFYTVGANLVFVYFYALFLPRFILVNLYLMFFNLLPIPPLDGSSIFAVLLPPKYLPKYYSIQRYAMPILLIVMFVLPYLIHVNLLGVYLDATAGNLARLLIP